MDLMENQQTPFLIVCPHPCSEIQIKEDLRSFHFRDAPIVVYECPDTGDYTPRIQPLEWCNNEDTSYKECLFCSREIEHTTGYYSGGMFHQMYYNNIRSIKYIFHEECIKPMKNHPYHPKHSLQILIVLESLLIPNKVCYCCLQECERFHYCYICNFRICRACVRKPPLLTIDCKKRHEHTLSYIPREAAMTCDVCALDDQRYFIYACHRCDFVVHKKCIYSPSIIKISRHEHRLSFTYSFLRGNLFCGVCHEKVDENYGGYSCVKGWGCGYVSHSKCALQESVWDGKELEGVPEEAYEDITPFKEIGNGIIQHFSHKHHMRLYKDVDKVSRCRACAFPIYEGDLFSCVECDFVLHKVCAYLPLKKTHVIHPHPLVLQKDIQDGTWFDCKACDRSCNSFAYRCERANVDCNFVLDVHCALISEPLEYHSHPHLLFLPSQTRLTRKCLICRSVITGHHLHGLDCGECDFFLCFRCVTLPKVFMYEHDEHPLLFSYEQDASDQYWCDVCEKETYLKNGVYMCKECDVTLHVECLFGEDMFMLPDKMISTLGRTFLSNNLTRQICAQCHKHCHQNKIFYRSNLLDKEIYCSMSCIRERYFS